MMVMQYPYHDGIARCLFSPIRPLWSSLSIGGMSQTTAFPFLILNSIPSRQLSGGGGELVKVNGHPIFIGSASAAALMPANMAH